MAEGNSIINFGDLSKPATVLIEKISNAVGILYEPRHMKNKAKAEVEIEKNKLLASFELSEIQQRGISRFINQEERKQEAFENITTQAISFLDKNANVNDLDEDWVAYFFKSCETVSDTQMQSLWAKMLSGEASKPGTFSKRSVDFISSMDKHEAALFTELCQFLVTEENKSHPLVFELENEVYKKKGISFDSLNHLDAIGLIKFDPASQFILVWDATEKGCFSYFDTQLNIEFPSKEEYRMDIGSVLLTQVGLELVPICGASRNESFFNYMLLKMRDLGVTLSCSLD